MKKNLIFLLILLLAVTANGQKEHFDIATFIAPKGWQRADTNGVLQFFKFRDPHSVASFCQIFLYPSRESGTDPMENFNAEWNTHVVAWAGMNGDPRPQAGKPDKGWTPVTGHVSTQNNGVIYNCILISATGYGRVMSIVINMAGQDYTADAEKFLDQLDLDVHGARGNQFAGPGSRTTAGPASGGQTSSGAASLDDYIYTAPPGWVSQRFADGIVLSPAPPNPERCNLTIHLLRPAGPNLVTDAGQIFNEVFTGFVGKEGMTSNSVIRGTSVQGWDYYIIKAAIGRPGGNYQTLFGFVCVIRLGNQLASISGISKDPLVSSCFGLALTDVWPKFFYSLQFRSWDKRLPEGEMMKRMAGTWMMATATAGDQITFAPNGRYANAAASQQYGFTSTSAVTITDAYFGNGAYSVKGNNILLTQDNDKAHPTPGWFRLEEESKDNGNTWKKKLYLTRTSTVDGTEYEVGFTKQQ
ncbi:MAG: hypothetical protein Q8938_06095 [Bacteroidota bacterium]|nr:hypothetical protein [Bacteroidota bacterium]